MLRAPASAPALSCSRSALVAVPADASFHPFLCTGDVQGDLAGNPTPAAPSATSSGAPTHPAFYRAADAEHIYFRMRVSGDPRKPGGLSELQPSSWDVLVDTDSDLRTYEYMFTADGNLPGGNARPVVRNSVQEPTESDRSPPRRQGERSGRGPDARDRLLVGEGGHRRQRFGGDPDYFITLVLPRPS